MTPDVTSDSPSISPDAAAALPDYLRILTQAAQSLRHNEPQNRPAASSVVSALVQAEKAAKQQRLTYPLEALAGQWRLGFNATRNAHQKQGVIQGRGWYMPKFTPAYISFTPEDGTPDQVGQGEIGNQIQLGPVQLKLAGPFRYPGKKNILSFDFTHLQLSVLGKLAYNGGFRGGKQQADRFYQQAIAKLPFFAFFLITDDFIAARGRSGGLALWVRER